jgi:glycosyltransferase EpsD
MIKKKVLFTASIALHFRAFHLPYLKWFQEQGYETHVACNDLEELPYVDKIWKVDFVRSPFSTKHRKAFKDLKGIIDNENFEIISTHTPMASIVTRIAASDARNKGTKVLYTAHGFHFFKGSPLFNWLCYYPVEIFLSRYADAIITINEEDFQRIKLKGYSKTNYFKIPGIGVNSDRFYPLNDKEKKDLRIVKGFPLDKNILIYAAEFIERKNHQFIIDAIANNKDAFQNTEVFFAGKGVLQNELEKRVESKDIAGIVKFIGFRRDIDEVYKLSDIAISASKQEGLGLNLLEAMMCGLPVIATEDRGHKEFIIPGMNGYLFAQENEVEFVKFVSVLLENTKLKDEMAQSSILTAKKFELSNSLNEKIKIYKQFMSV